MQDKTYLTGSYNKIPDDVRDRLVELVVAEKLSIKQASIELKLKYSTAKTIYKIYKKENRTFKYCSRSRNPGVVSSASINKIQKAPIPSFLLRRTVNPQNVCGIVKVRKIKRNSTFYLHNHSQINQLHQIQHNVVSSEFLQNLTQRQCQKNINLVSLNSSTSSLKPQEMQNFINMNINASNNPHHSIQSTTTNENSSGLNTKRIRMHKQCFAPQTFDGQQKSTLAILSPNEAPQYQQLSLLLFNQQAISPYQGQQQNMISLFQLPQQANAIQGTHLSSNGTFQIQNPASQNSQQINCNSNSFAQPQMKFNLQQQLNNVVSISNNQMIEGQKTQIISQIIQPQINGMQASSTQLLLVPINKDSPSAQQQISTLKSAHQMSNNLKVLNIQGNNALVHLQYQTVQTNQAPHLLNGGSEMSTARLVNQPIQYINIGPVNSNSNSSQMINVALTRQQ